MRLLLDEMYPPSIADGLRARGHDAVAVVERPELSSLPDPGVFAAAQLERRSVVTENVADYVRIANDHDARSVVHHGLILVHPARYPRGDPRTVGMMVTALDVLARGVPSDEPTGLRAWL
ncbi:MAG: DUF5615 family PIN-like protein [Solirubrobacteraceae bacterium MAG38_C4-C5]|nr:DUF5615 family PIN-like protein [Candidatus Siliceabacter maunaloa]